MKPRLLIVTANSFAHAYGGVLYLARTLHERGVDVRVLGHVPPEHRAHVPAQPFPVINLPDLPLATIPKVRGVIKTLRILHEGLAPGTHWLFNDYGFFRQAVTLKRLRPQQRLIHYTTELLTPEEQPHASLDFYARHASVPDLVIDVEPHRAARRQERFGLPRRPLVLPNTLPAAGFPSAGPPGTLARLAGGALPADRFILLYAGTAHPSMSFTRLLEAVRQCGHPLYLLCFLRGEAARVAAWQQQLADALGPEGGRICPAVPRSDLLRALPEADAGLIYYPPSDEPSVNQLYCAPTKLYEYLAAGLPVVGSANPSLRDLLEPHDLGFCADPDGAEGLATALARTVTRYGLHTRPQRARIASYFQQHLSFERTSEAALTSILGLIT